MTTNEAGHDLDLVADMQAPVHQRAGDDGAGAGDCEDAVDGQARAADVSLRGRSGQRRFDGVSHILQPLTTHGRAHEHGRTLRTGTFDCSRNGVLDQLQPLLIDEISLRDHDERLLDREQIENRQVFTRLRHDAFVGCDDEQRQVDAAGAGQHVLDEALVAGHVDNAGLGAVP